MVKVDLVNLMDHMRGKAVLVNGRMYSIDEEGIAKDVLDEDAAKLLQSKKWMVYDPEAAEKRRERQKAIREEFKKKKGSLALITKEGRLIDPKVIEATEKAREEKAKAEGDAIASVKARAEAIKKAEAELPDYPTMKSETIAESESEPELESEPEKPVPPPELPPELQPELEPESIELPEQEPIGDDEWPDPHMGMKKTFLQNMASAYGLSFDPQTKKQELVDMVMKAMYDET